jgi:hypothetical protein
MGPSLKSGFRFAISGLRLRTGPAAAVFKLPLGILIATVIMIMTVVPPSALRAEEQGPVIMSPHDFVEKNLNAYRERLRALKELYESQYGSIFAATSPTDVEAIAKELPKPTTLRLAVQFQEEKSVERKRIVTERGQYFVDSLSGYTRVDPFFNLTRGYASDELGRTGYLVAADLVSSQLLGLPPNMRFDLYGTVHWVSGERGATTGSYGEACCTSVGTERYCTQKDKNDHCVLWGSYNFCGSYAELPSRGYVWDDPRLYMAELQLRSGKTEGVTVDDKLRNATFASTGKKTVSFVSPRKHSSDEQYSIFRSCVPEFSYSYYGSSYYSYSATSHGLTKAVTGYRPAGEESWDSQFTAVALKGFGFPGYEIDASYGKMPDMDYFFTPDFVAGQHYWWGGSVESLSPLVLLDYGDAGGLKARRASDLKAPVTWSTISPGPFTIQEGGVTYRGGIGATKFRVTLGGYRSAEHSITANIIEVVLDPAMARGEVAPGKGHKVLVRVKGPADLNGYLVSWTATGGFWAEPVTAFKKVGEQWHAQGEFSVPFEGGFDPKQLRQPVKIAADVIRKKDNGKIYSYENSRLATTYPAVDKLELYAGIGRRTPAKVTGPIDLFISAETSEVLLSPRLTLKDGESYMINEVSPRANIELISSNPTAVYISDERARLRGGLELEGRSILAYPGERLGTSKVTARMGGSDIDAAEYAQFSGGRTELKSDPVEINVNNAFLLAEAGSGGRVTYKLLIMGPSDMTRYQARWTGEGTRMTQFKKGAGGFVSTLETTLRMDKVEIREGGATVAQLNVKTTVRAMNIKLLPPNPPVTLVNKVAVTDLGSLETITQCKKDVTRQMEMFGFNPGMAPEEYCKAERQKDKEEILSQREDQKAFNKMVRDLNRQGQDLVIMSDTMRVGAAIKGDLTGMGDVPFCYWTLENGGALALQSTMTPLETISPTEGGCFNTVKGLKGGFNPDTVIKVDLVMLSTPAVPAISRGGRVVTYGSALIR